MVNHFLQDEILEIIKQCTSYRYVDDNTNFNELNVDANRVLQRFLEIYQGVHLSLSEINGQKIGKIISTIERQLVKEPDNRSHIWKTLRGCSGCSFNWYNQYVYIPDARINLKQLVDLVNDSYGISLIKKKN